MSKGEQNRAFIKGKQVKLDGERLLLVEKTTPSLVGTVEVGWKNRMGLVSYRTAGAALRGSTLLFSVVKDVDKSYSVAVPLEGSDFLSDNDEAIIFRTVEGSNYLWVRFQGPDDLREWLTKLNTATKSEVTLDDFEIVRAVGRGGMGKVFLAKHRRTGERLALKVIEKKGVFSREGHLQHMVDERLLLEMGSDHPFVLKLRYAFQTESNFFLATEFCEGGDLYHLLKRRKKTLSVDATRMISTEVILALESMHMKGCVYRDLKPDNVLLDSEGHVRLADFGLAKILKGLPDGYERTNSFCGTAQYTPPEMVQRKYYTQSVDLWCLGVFLYEIVEGYTPFYTRDRETMYKRITREEVKFTSRFTDELKDLVEQLLEKNPNNRISLKEVKEHRFYEGIDWEQVRVRQFWPKGIYTAKERNEVAMEDLRMINTEKYKTLSVNEEEEVRGMLGMRIGGKKPPSQLVPGFSYTSPEIVEEEKQNAAVAAAAAAQAAATAAATAAALPTRQQTEIGQEQEAFTMLEMQEPANRRSRTRLRSLRRSKPSSAATSIRRRSLDDGEMPNLFTRPPGSGEAARSGGVTRTSLWNRSFRAPSMRRSRSSQQSAQSAQSSQPSQPSQSSQPQVRSTRSMRGPKTVSGRKGKKQQKNGRQGNGFLL